jgi:hypothetical protein
MYLTYAVAGTFAGLSGYLLFRPEKLAYFRKWDPIMLRLMRSSLFLCAAAIALLVTAVALSLNLRWESHGGLRSVEDGLSYGFATILLLHIEVTGPKLEVVLAPRWLFRLYRSRLDPFLTRGADTSVKRRLGDLKPPQIVEVSEELYARHYARRLGADLDLVGDDLARLHSLQNQALNSEFPPMADAALLMLRIQCEIEIKDHGDVEIDLPKPSVPRRRRRA